MCGPAGLTLDSTNDLYVSDYGNSRVLEFSSPLTNFAASLVIGQDASGSNFTSGICYGGQLGSESETSASAIGLCNPAGLAMDASNDLFVADTNNSRMIEFSNPAASTSATASPSSTPSATGTAAPTATATATATVSPKPSITPSPTVTTTPSPTASTTHTATVSATATSTPTATAATPIATAGTPTATASETPTPSPTPTPVAEKLTVSPKTLNFGKVKLQGSKTKDVTIKNDGKSKKGVTVQIVSESSSNPAFSVTQECSTALLPGKSCVVKIAFTPGADTKTQSGDLTISANLEGSAPTVTMKGSGKASK